VKLTRMLAADLRRTRSRYQHRARRQTAVTHRRQGAPGERKYFQEQLEPQIDGQQVQLTG
jgi:hypothetical protein